LKHFQRVSAGGGVPLEKESRLVGSNRTIVLQRPAYSGGMNVTSLNHDQPKRE